MKIYQPTEAMKREFKALGIPFPAFPLTVDQVEYLFHLDHLHLPNQHPDVSPTEHHAKAVARAYAHKPRWKRLGRWEKRLATGALLLLAILFAVYSAHAQTTNSNITSVGGTPVDPAVGIPTFCVSGCGGGGTVTANQGTAGASPWLVSGNIAVSWAAAQHIICDSGCGSSSVTQGTSPWVVSGAVTASWASAQHVIVDTAPTTAVTGTFWQATQPISGSVTVTQGTGANLHTVCDSGCGGAAADTTASGTLGSLNAALQVAMAGLNSASVTLPAANNLIGTLNAESSSDGGTTWQATVIRSAASTGLWASTVAVSSTNAAYNIQVPGGASHVRVRVNPYTSGTATASIRATTQPDSQPDPLVQGTQAAASATQPNPIVNGGWDGSAVRSFKTDNTGIQQMNITGISGTVTLGNLPQQPFLNTTDFNDVVAGSPVLGDTLYSNSTPKWTKLAGSTLSGGGGFLNETQATLAAPSAPVLTVSNTGGSYPQASLITSYVVITLNNAFGETTPSPESSILVSTANGCLAASTTCSVIVTAPTLTGNATGYTVYNQRDSAGEKQQAASNNCVNIVGNCVLQLLGNGVVPPTINTASNGTLVAPTWLAPTGTGAPVLASQATFIAKSINKTLRAEAFQLNGGDMCSAISAAIIALPSTGGTVDATGYQGAQNCVIDPFVAAGDVLRSNIEVIFGNVTIASTTQWTCLNGLHAHGLGDMSVIAFQPAVGAAEAIKADLWSCNSKSNVEIDHLKVTGTANTARLIAFDTVTTGRIHHVTCSGASYIPVAGPNACIFNDQGSDVWITDNVITNVGPGPASATSSVNGDIVVWQTAAAQRIHVRNNQISGSHTSASIQVYDCQDCDILDNTVDQNNTITTTLNVGGYAILSYQSTTRPRNMKIEGNHVTNCAGACIYLASNNQAIVTGNTVLTAGQQETDGTLPVAGIAVNDCLYCVVGDNVVKTSTKDGIDGVAPLTGSLFHHNSIFTVTQHGIQLRGAVADVTVSDNIIDTPTSRGIYAPTSTTRVIIKGNQIKGSLQNAMEFTSATDMDISDNIMSGWPTGLNAILISGGSTNHVCNNLAAAGLTNAIGMNLTMNTSRICENTIRNIGGVGMTVVMNDGEITGNICSSVTGACINDTGSLRNRVFGNHLLLSGAMTLVASDFVFGNEQDASGAVSRGNDLNLMVTGSNFVTAANTNLQTITGLSFTFPANMALNAQVDCDLAYSQQTAAVADAFGFQDATVAPTNLEATYRVQTAATTFIDGPPLTASSTTSATNIVAMTPSAITTIWQAKLHIGIEQPSNASTSLFSVMVKTGTSGDTVTVFRGSGCLVHFQ